VDLALHVPDLCGGQNKKLAHFGKLTEKDEPTLSGLLALARATLQMFKLCMTSVSLLLLPMSLVKHTGHVVA